MKTIHAVYENGVFRPLEAVDLPESCEVEVVPRETADASTASVDPLLRILTTNYDSGDPDVAARHNEHQP